MPRALTAFALEQKVGTRRGGGTAGACAWGSHKSWRWRERLTLPVKALGAGGQKTRPAILLQG